MSRLGRYPRGCCTKSSKVYFNKGGKNKGKKGATPICLAPTEAEPIEESEEEPETPTLLSPPPPPAPSPPATKTKKKKKKKGKGKCNKKCKKKLKIVAKRGNV